MGSLEACKTERWISGLDGQARIDALVDLFYSDDRNLLTNHQYMDLALPGISEMSRLYAAASSNDHFEWPSEPLETRWKCFHVGTCERMDRDGYDSEEIAARLADSLSEKRLEELRNGSPFSDEEWQQLKDKHNVSESETSEAVVAFETKDTRGRTMYFRAHFGDWGTLLMTFGPFSTCEDLHACFEGENDTVFEPVEVLWEAHTPNWDDDDNPRGLYPEK